VNPQTPVQAKKLHPPQYGRSLENRRPGENVVDEWAAIASMAILTLRRARFAASAWR
jgi:hypothetical protein